MVQLVEGTNHEEIVQRLSSEEIENKVVTFVRKSGYVDESDAARADSVKGISGNPLLMVLQSLGRC